jgi:polar amino acid transport system substrate-binding protein
MWPRWYRWLFGFGLLLWSILSAASCSRPLRVGWENVTPYNYEKEVVGKKQLTGLDIDILRATLQKMHCDAVFMDMPWSRQLEELRTGEIDVILGASRSPERQQFGHFSEPYRRENIRLYVKKGSSTQYPITDLASVMQFSMHIGVVRGNYYGENFQTLLLNPRFNASIEAVSNDLENFRKLTVGHVQGILVDSWSATQILRAYPAVCQQVEVHPFTIFSDDVSVLFSKKSITPALVTQFNIALSELKKDSEYNMIWQHYAK